ncbi:hypothetical protein VTK26DRAFT_1415 [Humicola hyalothermophila]
MPRKTMPSSSDKRRPAPGSGSGSKGASSRRSPSRASRTSPTNTRHASGGSSNNTATPSTIISPPPRAALSGTSSPVPDHPRNAAPPASARDPTTTATSSSLTIDDSRARASDNRAPSPSPSHLPLPHPHPRPSSSSTSPSSSSPSPPQPENATAVLHASQAAAAALREKDTRIAALERELALMESEFVRALDKLAAAESETAAFWQAKYARLEAELERVLSSSRGVGGSGGGGNGEGTGGRVDVGGGRGAGLLELRPGGSQEAKGSREAAGSEVVNGSGDRVGNDTGDGNDDARRAEQRDEELRELRRAWERARESLARRDEEIQALRAQVRGLKEWVSTSTRADGQAQTSDEVFAEGMARLGNGLQNWVLVNFRRSKIDLAGADADAVQELGRLVPMYEDLASTSKIHLLQSAVSRILVEHVFNAYFIGLSSDAAQQLKQTEALLTSLASSPESINQWRSLTLTILHKKDVHDKMQPETAAVTHTVMRKVNTLLDAITTTNTPSTETRNQGLQALITSAIDLARLLAVQKAVFAVDMPVAQPYQRVLFDPDTMEDIGGGGEDDDGDEDDDDDDGGSRRAEICCVTFPGLVKRGDESGNHLQYRNVIAKARVLLRSL